MAHVTEEACFLTRSPVYYKSIQFRNSQAEEMGRARYEERRAFKLIFSTPLFLILHLVTNPEALWTPALRVFIGASLFIYDWLNHCPLAIDSTAATPLWRSGEWAYKLQPSNHKVGSSVNQPLSLGAFWKSPH